MPETKFNKSPKSYPILIYKNALSLLNVVMRIFVNGKIRLEKSTERNKAAFVSQRLLLIKE